MDKLCYVLIYTGNNKKILARTILLYEILSKFSRKDIWVVTDSDENKKVLEPFVKNVYVPENMKKYEYDSIKKYPNIYIKFSTYELKKFGYTHCIEIDTDVIVNYDLVKHIGVFEKYILENITEGQIAMHRYPIWETKSEYHGSCLIFNIEKDLSDDLLNLKKSVDGWDTEEVALTNYARLNSHSIRDIPDGFICNQKEFSRFIIFKHLGGVMFYVALTATSDFKRYKELCEILETGEDDIKLF